MMYLLEPNISSTIATAIITAISTLGVSYFVNVASKKAEAKKEIKLAEISIGDKEYEATKKELHAALDAIKNLKSELDKEKEIRVEVQRKFEAVKLAFKIIFNQYAKQFKDDPEQLDMLEELKKIIER